MFMGITLLPLKIFQTQIPNKMLSNFNILCLRMKHELHTRIYINACAFFHSSMYIFSFEKFQTNNLIGQLKKEIFFSLQEIHSLPTKITDGLNYVGNYRRNIDGTKHIIFSTFLLPFTYKIPTENYQRKCSVGNFCAICRRQLLGTIYRQNTYGKLPTEVFRR